MTKEKLGKLQELINLQALDPMLWSTPQDRKPTIFEAYLQQELRRVHLIVESENMEEIEGLIEDYKSELKKYGGDLNE